MRIVLVGKAGSGKDTVADYLNEVYGFTKRAFADELRIEAYMNDPFRYQSDYRAYLQEYGQAMRELHGEDYWINKLFDTLPDGIQFLSITDCRYENEYERCVAEGFIPVKINCDDFIRNGRLFMRDGRQMTEEELSHKSEQLEVPCSYYLDNNLTFDQLYNQIDKMIEDERGGVCV